MASKALAVLVGGSATAQAAGPMPPLVPGLSAYQAAAPPPPPPPPVGGLPLQGLEVGGVGPSGGAGAAAFQGGSFFVSASSYPANAPVEDRFDVRPWRGGSSGGGGGSGAGLLAAVFDGHGGWQAAEHARCVLLGHLEEELRDAAAAAAAGAAPAASPQPQLPAEAAALVRAFLHTERSFIDAIRPAYAVGFGEVSHVGACALAAVLTERAAVVANAGDCRAVLGHLCLGRPPADRTAREGEAEVDGHAAAGAALLEAGARGGGALLRVPARAGTPPFTVLPEPAWRWRRLAAAAPPARDPAAQLAPALTAAAHPPHQPPPFYLAAIPMSLDHNAREPREKARLAAEHPGEADVVLCRKDSPTSCYVKGRLQPTRALGDAYLKHAEFNEDGGRVRGRHIKGPFTPPYVTACVLGGALPPLLLLLLAGPGGCATPLHHRLSHTKRTRTHTRTRTRTARCLAAFQSSACRAWRWWTWSEARQRQRRAAAPAPAPAPAAGACGASCSGSLGAGARRLPLLRPARPRRPPLPPPPLPPASCSWPATACGTC